MRGVLRGVRVAATLSVAAVTWAATGAVSAPRQEAHDHEQGRTPQARIERRHLIDEGEARLRAGEVAAAQRAFEQAAQSAHEAEIELGWLRAQMQAGQYRQALAFAAHTAGVHLDHVEGAAFYAWLLNLGAQVPVATQTLQQVQDRVPGHPLVQAVQRHWQSGALAPSADILSLPARMAPYASGEPVPAGAAVVATGLLLADGEHALVPRMAVPDAQAATRLWLRNGLGQTVAARPADLPGDAAQSDLLLWRLERRLPVAGGELVAPRDAFPGTPVYAVDQPASALGEPAWPVMRAGFLGLPLASAPGKTRLGATLPASGSRGGPVYDQGGRLVGVALGQVAPPGSSAPPDLMLPVGALRARFGERFGRISPQARPTPVGADELYELVLRTSLQVLVLPR